MVGSQSEPPGVPITGLQTRLVAWSGWATGSEDARGRECPLGEEDRGLKRVILAQERQPSHSGAEPGAHSPPSPSQLDSLSGGSSTVEGPPTVGMFWFCQNCKTLGPKQTRECQIMW